MGMGPNIMDLTNDHLGFDNPTKALFHGASLNEKDWVTKDAASLPSIECCRCHESTDHPKPFLGMLFGTTINGHLCTDCYILMHEGMNKFLEGWEEVTV